MTEEKRFMTVQEEKIYRLVSHDFEGLDQQEAAERLGVDQSQVSRTLKKVEQEHPELFPILNSRQHFVYEQIVGFGRTYEQIADLMCTSVKAVERIVSRLRKKGVCFNSPAKTVRYETYHDDQVKHKY